MDYSVIEPCLIDVVRRALEWTGAEFDGRVTWASQEDSCFSRPLPFVELELDEIAGLGIDETRYEYNETTDQMEARQCGLRVFNLRVKVVSDSACGNLQARFYADRLRLRLRRACNIAVLSACGLAITTFQATSNVHFSQDRRTFNAVTFLVGLSWAEVDTPDDCQEATEYFTDVEITGNVALPESTNPGDPPNGPALLLEPGGFAILEPGGFLLLE